MKLWRCIQKLVCHKVLIALIVGMIVLWFVVNVMASHSDQGTLMALMKWVGGHHTSWWIVLILQIIFIGVIWFLWEQRIEYYRQHYPTLPPVVFRQAKLLRLAFIGCIFILDGLLFF